MLDLDEPFSSHARPTPGTQAMLACVHQGHVDDVLGDKPDLKFVPSNDVADDEIVGAVVVGAKTRELIALAVAVTRQCDGCITIHTDAALKYGATGEEVAEALGVAIAVNAGASLVYSARVMDAYAAKTAATAHATDTGVGAG